MKYFLSVVFAVCLVASYAGAAENLLDGCEDIVYATACGSSDSIALANSTTASEGSNSLDVTYGYIDEPAWYKNAVITKTFATPVDLSAMEALKVDFNVLSGGHASFYVMFYMTDEQGYIFRAYMAGALGAGTSGWHTSTARLSTMDNTEWAANGRPVNLKKIASISLHIMNGGAFGAAGSVNFLMDNVRFVRDTGLLQEVTFEDFESYTTVTEADAAWAAAFSGRPTTTELDLSDPFAGSKSYIITSDLNTGKWTNWGREYVLSATQDWSAVKYIKLGLRGDADLANYNPTAHVFLKDSNGYMALAYIWGSPAVAEWSEMFLTFQGTGIQPHPDNGGKANTIWQDFKWDAGVFNIADISSIILAFETQDDGDGYPVDANIGFDSFVLGYATATEQALSVQNYQIGLTSSPTIDGQVAVDEWNDAGLDSCTGFVQHNNNTRCRFRRS